MNGGLTAEFTDGWASGLGAALRLRYLGPRPANEQNTPTAQGWTLLDPPPALSPAQRRGLARPHQPHRHRLARGAVRREHLRQPAQRPRLQQPGQHRTAVPVQGSRPAQNAFADGIDGVSFTPGNPFGVRGGPQVFF